MHLIDKYGITLYITFFTFIAGHYYQNILKEQAGVTPEQLRTHEWAILRQKVDDDKAKMELPELSHVFNKALERSTTH